ncbi:putative aminotransferase family protein [Biscogniauxia marginata]|nr:putative aminotransferase family protein [Biscogniauxia marginata]
MASSSSSGPTVPFGAPMRHAHFAFSPDYTPLNHGSYGAHPVSVRAAHLALGAEAESAPDPFIALGFTARLARSRALAAAALRCAADDELVFVPNATTGIDTVLRGLEWEDGDVALTYEVAYEAVANGVARAVEASRGAAAAHTVRVAWPVSDDDLVAACVGAARAINNSDGGSSRRVRLAIVDTVVSLPGARVPFERLVPALQAEGALVLVDGAHGIGHIDIDLAALRPDFFVSNLHKWLFVPRACAALVVPRRNRHLVRSSLPTSFGFRPRGAEGEGEGEEKEGAFAEMFDFLGTANTTNYLCVQAALDFRNQVCGGEEAIRAYSHSVAQRGAAVAAEILGTEIMDIEGSCMRQCNFANVRLPLELDEANTSAATPRAASTTPGEGQGKKDASRKVDPKHAGKVSLWLKVTGVKESGMYFQTCFYRGVWWWRLSGMIYLEVDDFRRGAEVLKALCERVRDGEHVTGE